MKFAKFIVVVWLCVTGVIGAWVIAYTVSIYREHRIHPPLVLVDDGPWTHNVRSVTNLVVLSMNVVSNAYTYSFAAPEKGDTNSATASVKMKPDWTIHTNISIGYFDGTNAIEVFKVRWD